jgi:uncharacterized caspase-like protein
MMPGARLHVLTVGVSDYGEAAGGMDLEFAANDARDVALRLLTSQSQLYAAVMPQVLLNKDATRASILRSLAIIRENMANGGGNDVAVVHFSGHGLMLDHMFYLMPYEVDTKDPVSIRATSLALDELRRELAQLADHGRVIVMIDACRSGAIAAGPELTTNADTLLTLMHTTNVAVMSSSSHDENSIERATWQNGAFTEAALEALTSRGDEDRNGLISVREMADYIYYRVQDITEMHQTPKFQTRFESNVFALAEQQE